MSIRRATAYLGLIIGLILLIWAAFLLYPLQDADAQASTVNGYTVVREAARDGLARDTQGRLVKRQRTKPKGKDDKTCPT